MNKTKQKFDWGSIEWVYLPPKNSNNTMHVGFSTISPHTIQQRHIHYGDEQLMYIISGHGKQRIGNKVYEISPGKTFHVSSGAVHETVNNNDEPIKKIFISIPSSFENRKETKTKEDDKKILASIHLKDILKEIYSEYIKPLKMPVAFLDAENKLVLFNGIYPDYCNKKCKLNKNLFNCELYSDDALPAINLNGISTDICRHGIALFSVDIHYQDTIIGHIRGGRVRVKHGDESKDLQLYDVPESTIDGINNTLNNLAFVISKYYRLEIMKRELLKQHGELTEQQLQKDILQESLKNTQSEKFNLQIEQHFLFNTLSSIAGLALHENAITTYTAINDMSQMFRYTLRTNKLFVELKDELAYLESYTNLEKLRYGNRFVAEYKIDPSLLSERVPFNFLEPIVGNCIKHAFKKQSLKKLKVSIKVKKLKNNLVISIQDNGSGFSSSGLMKAKNRIAGTDNSGGTAMVARKLESLYGSKFNFVISNLTTGSKITLTIPMVGENNEKSINR